MKIPAATLAYWTTRGFPPATPLEIAELEALAGQALPADLIGFLRTHGFVEWDIDIPDTFDYRLGQSGQTVVKSAYVGRMASLHSLRDFVRYGRAENPSLGLPQFPPTYWPVVRTPGQDVVLTELGPSAGRIWYWPERADPWGTGDNTELGFVADSFTAFIEGLRLGSD
ncbi:MAG: SMI1/KNR4 family protein [Rhodobacteraceae bacterium]|nr:SMI1/KNR4 family protein [Paracoccaceae bacterium]